MEHYPDLRDDEIFARIKQLKPYISDYICLAGMTRAKELLFREEYLTEDIKKEIDLWDRIDD